MKRLIVTCAICLILAGGANADITVYTSQASWQSALSTPVNIINWDDLEVTDGSAATILGNRYSALPGGPALSVDATSGLYVIDPGTNYYAADFIPVSGENVFAPDAGTRPVSPQGILTISFATPVYALAAWFLDVEGDYATTGIVVGNEARYFSSSQGDNSQSFLGIVSSTPFLTAEIRMASGPEANNGVGIDDTMYAIVPVPGAVLLGLLGLGAAGIKLRRRA